jgi:hypothetical protein
VNRTRAAALAILALVAACGGDEAATDTTTTSTTTGDANPYGAQVASYDLSTDGPQRFLVGLLGEDGGLIVGGEVTLEFRFFGADPTETANTADGELRLEDVPAVFTAVGAGIAPAADDGPRLRAGEEGVGVYEAEGVTFDDAGFWAVTVRAVIDHEDVSLAAAFEVAEDNEIVNAGDPAPRTVNHLPGAVDTPVQAIDSRAEDDGSVPDPELHTLTVADAIATGRPTVVVVSTPVFCVSRFCGPITDSIQAIAGRVGETANFVHLEVWRDFEANTLNAGAAEWIYPREGVEPFEPWVFLVDGAGTVVQRWDNVANEAAVEAALRELTG